MRSTLTAVVLLLVALPLPAQVFTKVADTATSVVGGTGNYTSFANGNAIDASGNVAFWALGASSQEGVYYSGAGTLSRVADKTTSIPGGTGSFSFFNSTVSTLGGNVAYNAGGASSQSGIYHYNGTTTVRWADTNTSIPGGTGTFTGGVRAPYLSGTTAAFIGQDSDFTQQGIYVTDGATASRMVDKTSTIPGLSGSYGWSSQLAHDNGNIAFAANNTPGVLTILGGYSSGGGLVTLAGTSTTAPGAGTAFTSFESPPDISAAEVFFKGSFAGGSGLYTVDVAGGAITRLVDTSMAAVGASGNFTSFGGFAISGDRLAFQASFSGGSAIYVSDGATATWLIGTGDALDGRTVASVGFGTNGLAGDFLAFKAVFSDSSSGVFSTQLAAIPEPAACAALAGLLGLALAVRCRRSGGQAA